MPKSYVWLVLALFLLTGPALHAQDVILLLNGKTVNCKVVSTDSAAVNYQQTNKRGKTKDRAVGIYRVFSITNASGEETVVYRRDTLFGNYFSQHEMRMFIYGEQDAQRNYRSPLAFPLSALASGGLTYGLANSFFVFAVPFTTSVGSGIPGIKVRNNTVRDEKYLSEPAYILGYERTARSKRIFRGMLGSVVGFGAALGLEAALD